MARAELCVCLRALALSHCLSKQEYCSPRCLIKLVNTNKNKRPLFPADDMHVGFSALYGCSTTAAVQ